MLRRVTQELRAARGGGAPGAKFPRGGGQLAARVSGRRRERARGGERGRGIERERARASEREREREREKERERGRERARGRDMGSRSIANKYHAGTVKRTLKIKVKVFEVAENEVSEGTMSW